MSQAHPTNSAELIEYFAKRKAVVEQALDARLPPVHSEPKRVHEAMRYATTGGKRLRPILVLAVGELAGQRADQILDTACAIEFVHTASLVLDDLPSMDNATERRGRSCTHEVFGQATAILASLDLITLGFDLVARNAEARRAASSSVGHAVGLLAGAIDGLIGGQDADLALADSEASRAELEQLYEQKAGALFVAAVQIPAYLLGLPSSEVEVLETYARNLGLAFQITDDLLDAGDLAKEAAKTTLSTHLGTEGARRKVAELTTSAIQVVESFSERGASLRGLAEYVRARIC